MPVDILKTDARHNDSSKLPTKRINISKFNQLNQPTMMAGVIIFPQLRQMTLERN